MTWALLLGLHLTGLVGYTLLLRKSALGGMNKLFLAALMQTGIFLPVLVVILLGDLPSLTFTSGQWIGLVASGLLIVGLHLTAIKALQRLEASIFTIIYNLRLFITTILGFIFLHELPTGLQIAGGIIIFISILLLNLHKNRRFISTPILLGLLATAWFSVHATLEKHNVLEVGFTDYMFWSQGLGMLLLWALVWKSDVNLSALRLTFDWHTIRLVTLRSMSAWGYTYALKYGSLAVTNYVSGLGVALIVLFGVFLLGEKERLRQKIYAVSVAALGLTLILAGKL
jgi:drug/metabolite transporter (DMT)-like permease